MLDKLKSLSAGRRPAHSLLFVTEVKTFRVDTDRKGVLLGDAICLEYGCKKAAGLAKTFSKIAEDGPPLGRKVWILFLRLQALSLSVPSLQVQGVDEATLAQALQFEAEGMTGLSSQEMRMAYRFLKAENEMSDYWLVQMEQLAWDDLLKAVKASRCRLAGVLHPGALPLAIQDTKAAEWLRIEAWSTLLLAIHRTEAHFNLTALGFDNPRWQAELEQWLQEQGELPISESLLNNRMEMLPDMQQHYSLNENRQMTQWLGLWAQCLVAQKAAEVALIEPESAINIDVLWMVGSGATALLLCGLHASWFVYQRAHFEAETARLTTIEQNVAQLRNQINETRDQKEKMEKSVQKLSAAPDLIPNTINLLRQRYALLLRALAEGRHPRLIVETLASEGDDVVIGGVALDQQLPNQLASYLSQVLAPLNWEVATPIKNNMALFEDVPGPWSFQLVLKDQGVPALSDDVK
ncbi:MAG: hypothetical protein Kow0065_03830 [Methylomicrobium sp.]